MSDFNPDEYQRTVDKLLEPPERNNLELLTGQLCSESGELFGKLTKINRLAYRIQHHDKDVIKRDHVVKWRQDLDEMWRGFDKELTDVCFYFAAIAAYRAKTVADVQQESEEKLLARQARGTLTQGSGDDR